MKKIWPDDSRGWRIPALAGCLLAAGHVLYLPRATIDDAFISFRYALNLVEGNGLVFNPGERVEGYSNLLWVLLTAGGMALGFDPENWSRALGAVSLLGLVAAGATLAFRLIGTRMAAWATALIMGASTALVASSVGGMETSLFGLLLVLSLLALIRARPVAASLLMGLACLCRPEGVFIFIAVVMLRGWLVGPTPDRRERMKLIVPGGILFAGQVIFRFAYYGTWIPNSVLAKSCLWPVMRAMPTSRWTGLLLHGDGMEYVSGFIEYGFGGLALAVLLPLLRNDERRHWALILGSVAVCGCAVALANFGDWMTSFRLLTPYMPFCVILVVWGWHDLIALVFEREDHIRRRTVLCTAICLFIAWRQFQIDRPAVRNSPDVAIASLLSASSQEPLLAATDVLGRLSFFAPRIRVLDMAGLTDPWIARHGEPRPPYGRYDFDYVLGLRPHFIMNNVRDAWTRRLNRKEFADDYWWVDYAPWTRSDPNGGWPRYVFVRRGTQLEEEFRKKLPRAFLRQPVELVMPRATTTGPGLLDGSELSRR